jgi:hypothetical protein
MAALIVALTVSATFARQALHHHAKGRAPLRDQVHPDAER